MITDFKKIRKKFRDGDVTVAVVGLGYVGLPLAVTFASKGTHVIGVDTNHQKIEAIENGVSYIADVTDAEIHATVSSGTLCVVDSYEAIAGCDAVIMCIPTPLDQFKKPDMSFIEDASGNIGRVVRQGTLISLESTTYPTTTENLVLPILEKESGMIAGRDFWLCYSPERIDPGNKEYKTGNTPKIIGAIGEEARELGMLLYGRAIQHLYPVSSPRVAEMAKILENTYRLVNISLINELALLSGRMDIDIWEVIDAARTKPYGFHAFYPGPGIGGHCIPLDPFYLEHVAKNYSFDLTMIHAAGQINTLMPHRMAVKIMFSLNKHKKPINGSKILFLGVAYKPNIADERESPALKIIDEVVKKHGIVSYHDPYISAITTAKGHSFTSNDLTDDYLRQVDCVVISTNHSCFDIDRIMKQANLIVDLQNATGEPADNVYRL